MSNSISKIPISLSWSGGKDSAFALWKLQNDSRYEVTRLHTTLGEQTRRVGMHGIHEDLIQAQAEALGIPLDRIYYPASGDNVAYEKAINKYLDSLGELGVKHIAYGDIFLEDLRKYREEKLAERNFQAVFPLWKFNTQALAHEFIAAGFKTKICAASAELINENQVGIDFSEDFLESLPELVDPCGENGEFHSFCYAGPVFARPLDIYLEKVLSQTYQIPLENGTIQQKKYWFADIRISNSGF